MRISDWSSDVCSSDLHAYLPNPIVPGSQSDSGEYATTSARPTASSAMKGRTPRTTSDKRARVIPWMVNKLSPTGGVIKANSIKMTSTMTNQTTSNPHEVINGYTTDR